MQPESETRINLQVALAGEADANRRYIAYGIRALYDGHPEVAQIFFEAAGAETVHAYSHLQALGAIGTTEENLKTAATGEAGEIDEMYPRMIAQAEAEGNAAAAASFRLALEREKHHQRMFRTTLDTFYKNRNRPDGSTADKAGFQTGNNTGESAVTAESRVPIIQETDKAVRPATVRGSNKAATYRSGLSEDSGVADSIEGFSASEIETEAERISRLSGIKEIVFGSQDGLISTTTLVLGVAAASTSVTAVLIAGGVALVAGTLSMAVGSYLSSRAERQLFETEIRKERGEMQQKPGEEIAELIAAFIGRGMPKAEAVDVARRTAKYPNLMLELLTAFELGLARQSLASPVRDALVMGTAFAAGSIVPLLPFVFLGRHVAIQATVAAAFAALFVVGALKGKLSRRSVWTSGLEVLLLGGASGAIGYLMGQLVSSFAHVSI